MKLRCKAHLAINLLVGTANTGQQLRLSEKKSFTLHHTRDFAQGPGSCFLFNCSLRSLLLTASPQRPGNPRQDALLQEFSPYE
jgi:hypothetical protein